jgi:hypothetical protein
MERSGPPPVRPPGDDEPVIRAGALRRTRGRIPNVSTMPSEAVGAEPLLSGGA